MLSEYEFDQFLRSLRADQDFARKVLADRTRLDWQGSKELLEKIRDEQARSRSSFISWNHILRIAAAVLLLFTVWVFWPESSSKDLVFETDYGQTRDVYLPDGSRVLMNANSKMVWHGDWSEVGHRSVTLEGEAFFEVVKTNDMHFKVQTPDIIIDVLGTEFNVRSRGAETNIYLKEGKVRLEVNNPDLKNLEMVPGDFVNYDHIAKELNTSHHFNTLNKASWVDGMLDFQNESVPRILKEFENLYGKRFRVDNELLMDKRMDISLPYTDWNLVRKALEIALDAEFTTFQDTIIVK